MNNNSVIQSLYSHYLTSNGIATDSRNITPGALFFALRGSTFNGNKFAEEALKKGASFAIIDDINYKKDDRYIVVEDTLVTLQNLATHHRQQLNIPIIGITGSNGKTTTKELTRAVLATRYNVLATRGNLNNHIGVPLTILSITPDIEIAIIEMGANHVGEIATLAKIAQPTHGLITNVGHVHIEGFGSFEGVIKGKSELYTHLHTHKGTIFVNSKDDILYKLATRKATTITYPGPQDFLHCQLTTTNPFVVCKTEDTQISSQLLGKHHFNNIATALCIGKYFHIDGQQAADAIAAYRPDNNRSQVIQIASNTIILDAYNANPKSMQAAIEALSLVDAKNKVLILGDMAELGDETESAHQAIGKLTKNSPYKAVLLCGPHMLAAQAENPAALHFPNKEALQNFLRQTVFQHTAFLIKGSRSLQLETLVKSIKAE